MIAMKARHLGQAARIHVAGPARAAHPDALALHPTLQLAAAAALLQEGVKRGEQAVHGGGRLPQRGHSLTKRAAPPIRAVGGRLAPDSVARS